MDPLWYTILRFAFLGLLYLFVWIAVRQVVVGVAGRGGPRRIEPARAPAPASGAFLVIREPDRPERTVPIVAAVLVGRAEDADITLDDGFASQRHARIAPSDGGWNVEDLGSRNGTAVNGRTIASPTTLRPGDTVRVGETTLEVRA
ncbi:MAG: FHA domain-containing protein [Actinomycetota bacterium]